MNSVITDTVMKAAENIQEFKIPLKTWDGNPCIYRNCIISSITCM